MAICNRCGKKYSKWTTPVSAKGICAGCFQVELSNQDQAPAPEPELMFLDVAPQTQAKIRRIHFRSFLPRTTSPVVYAIVMACYSITLSSLMAGWARAAHLRRPSPSFYLRGDPADIVSLLVIAPLVESFVLIGVFELLRRCRAPERVQIFVTALFISGLHAPKWWPHAFIVLPSFCIQTASYLYWRRMSWKTAFWVVALIHALDNVLPALSAFTAYTLRHVPLGACLLR